MGIAGVVLSIPKIENWTVTGSTMYCLTSERREDENVRSTYCPLYPALKAEMAEILVHSVGYTRLGEGRES